MSANRGSVPVLLRKRHDAEVLMMGSVTCYVLEDGSATANRVAAAVLMIPAGASGPLMPMHWHRFHDELFLVTKGTVHFLTREGSLDVAAGDLMVVPPRAVQTFANASATEDAELYMTATPGYMIDFFRMLAQAMETNEEMDEADHLYLMAQFGTFPHDVPSEP